ncbi:MAG: GNAT family N-acetyltransferase [Betaproteobacteria bacterium]|nr:GNAT family N-acetyltransferase [Betaproteobacteria bacterium]
MVSHNYPFLVGERLYLRGLAESDVEGPYPAWLNDQETCAGNSHAVFPYGTFQAAAYIREVQTNRDALVLAIVASAGDRHIGNIALQNIHPIHRSADLAILLGEREYWGQGYGLEAARLLCRHGFAALNLHRIQCGTYESNGAMQKLALALGMCQEGVRRQAAYKSGDYVNVVEYGLLRNELIVG